MDSTIQRRPGAAVCATASMNSRHVTSSGPHTFTRPVTSERSTEDAIARATSSTCTGAQRDLPCPRMGSSSDQRAARARREKYRGKPMFRFRNRAHAGQLLAQRLQHYADREETLVLALPRGGVVVGDEIARALRAPLDVLIVRKLGVPGREELAMGAIASGGVQVLDEALINELGLSEAEVARVIAQEQAKLSRREHVFRANRPFPALKGRAVILVDDGIATGATMAAAAHAVRSQSPARFRGSHRRAASTAKATVTRRRDRGLAQADDAPGKQRPRRCFPQAK